ncbi:MAG: PQQ-like beta-propeller repeat protein [Acidobacteria bacterium]|nr:PQQ-like beta-propeller repeat protein [Acidobacteriota bacterium]
MTDLARPVYVRWLFKTESVTNLTPAADNERAYMPLDNGSIVSVGLSDGGLVWRSDVGGALSASPAVDNRNVYVASESLPTPKSIYPQATGVLRALSRQSGLTSWMRTLPSPVRGIINLNTQNLFVTSSDGRLYVLKKETGEIKWIKYNSSPFTTLNLLDDETLYASDTYGDIISIEPESGRTLWRYRTRKALSAPVAVYGSMVYAGAADGFVYAIDRTNGRLRWRVRAGAAIQAVLAGERWVLATSLDNFVYCLSPQNGAKIWKRQLAGRVTAPPLVLKNQVLLAPLVGDECVVLNLADGKKVNSIYVGEDNNTEAAPLLSADALLLTTREGLMALTNNAQTSNPPQ